MTTFAMMFTAVFKRQAKNYATDGIVNENEQTILTLNEKELIEFRGAPKTGGYYLKDIGNHQ